MARATAAMNPEEYAEALLPSPEGLYLIGLPAAVYHALATEAGKRNMNLAQFLAAAIDAYVASSPTGG